MATDKPDSTDNNSENSSNKVEPSLPEDLEDILKELPEDKRKSIIQAFRQVSVTHESSFSSPLPPPDILKGYNEALQDGAERVVGMTESQAQHRKEQENKITNEMLRESKWGQIFAFILGLLGLVSATILGLYGSQVVAGIIGGGSLVGLVTAFLLGKSSQHRNDRRD